MDFHMKYLGIFTSKIEKDDGEDIGIQSLLKLHPLEIIDFCFSWVWRQHAKKVSFLLMSIWQVHSSKLSFGLCKDANLLNAYPQQELNLVARV